MNDNCEVEILRTGLERLSGINTAVNVEVCRNLANYIADSSISYLCREEQEFRNVVREWMQTTSEALYESNYENNELYNTLQRAWDSIDPSN